MARANRLAAEKSPYLLQHAYNPVDWYAWGDEAFDKARELDRPILLSIGYATCHWCHVMEKESFEDEATADILNRHFIAIKVDREELPDVDHIYMRSLQAMGQQGGWPLNVFLTTELKPFTGGTYFPPRPMQGRPSFQQILETIANLWQNDRQKLLEPAQSLADFISRQEPTSAGDLTEVAPPGLMTSIKAVQELHSAFDHVRGGFLTNGQNKFPPSMALIMLAHQYEKNSDTRCLQMIETTLDAMKRGGIYDQIGGGLARYSTDHDWLVPHFEKMLYDNALFARALTEAYRITRKDRYKQWAQDVYQYIFRDMTAPSGAFYSAEDADSDGEEGLFYIWTESELSDILTEADFSKDQIRSVFQFWGVTSRGNFEGRSILYEPIVRERTEDLISDELILKARKILLQRRSKRNRPLRDDKVLTSWNALMISTLARSSILFKDDTLLERAKKAADFLMNQMVDSSTGYYFRRYRDGEAKYTGTLSDHSMTAVALIDLYRADPDSNYLKEAIRISELVVNRFREKDNPGAFFETADTKNLIVRPIDGYDGVIPSGNSTTALMLLLLASMGVNREQYLKAATGIFNYFKGNLLNYPTAHPFLLYALFLLHEPPLQIVIDSKDPSDFRKAMEIAMTKSPEPVVISVDKKIENEVTLIAGKESKNSMPAFFYCHDFTCESPVHSIEDLEKLMN